MSERQTGTVKPAPPADGNAPVPPPGTATTESERQTGTVKPEAGVDPE